MQNVVINDFGQKIGGAKKDLARRYKERLDEITDGTLLSQPLAKVFPRPDLVKMVKEKLITKEKAILMQYMWENVEPKPRQTYSLKKWVEKTMNTILAFRLLLGSDVDLEDYDFSSNEDFQLYKKTMLEEGFPEKEFILSPYSIVKNYYWGGYYVRRGKSSYKSGTYQECLNFIKDKKTQEPVKKKMRFSIYRINATGERYITPEGKSGINLKGGFLNYEDASVYCRDHADQLEAEYIRLRTIPSERNEWNRPRVGKDYRNGLDVLPETFSEAFPFRGVEFGNWVTQIERAASLNEAYDALMDLANVIGVSTEIITLNGQLALAFGARGSGNFSAHYERVKVVINLTKTRGAGSFAHEWFHGLDNFIMRSMQEPFGYASEEIRNKDSLIIKEFINLNMAIRKTDFYTRSAKIDKFRSKPYWSTAVELNARAFEKYCIYKLQNMGVVNDYLANIRSFKEYPRPEIYPYPKEDEIKLLSPYFDNLLKTIFHSQLTTLQQVA